MRKNLNEHLKAIFILFLLVVPLFSARHVFAATTATWASRASLDHGVYGLGAVTATNGKIYAIGGSYENCGCSDRVEEYDPATDTWTERANMPTPRYYLGVTLGLNGKIYAIGGEGQGNTYSTVEEYDPATDTWATRANMLTPRRGLAVATGSNGKIYAIGGWNAAGAYISLVEEYDPATDTWSPKASMHTARTELAAAATVNGKIYAIGGNGASVLSTVEEYDINSNSWTFRTGMPVRAQGLGAVTSPNGKIYAFGGRGGAGDTPQISRLQEYNPNTDTWALSTDLPTTRWFLGAAVTSDGKLYAIGGHDWNGGVTQASVDEGTITVTNDTPIVDVGGPYTVSEGNNISVAGSFTDDSTSWTATVDYGDGSGTVPLTLSGMNFSLSHIYNDNGTYTVTVSVTDNQGATGQKTASITVNNVAPSVGTISASVNPVQINAATTLSASFTDAGVLDTHTASWNWGDGNTTPGTVSENNGSGTVSDSHIYTTPGVYTVTLTVTDNSGGAGTAVYQYVSAYNPTAQGLFTGARIFNSPAGAYTQDLNLTGQVQFGVVAKYSGSAPTGSVKMDFKAANFNFVSNAISLLVIANDKATLKGSGTVNGSGNYTFLVTGIDGQATGGNTIRIQIKDSLGNVIYDAQPGASDITDPTTAVTGQVIVH